MDTKECSRCHLPKPLDQFSRRASARDGRTSACKACINGDESYRKHRQSKRLERRDQALAWQAAHEERYKRGQKAWRGTHRTRLSARATERRHEHPEAFRAKRRTRYAANAPALRQKERDRRVRRGEQGLAKERRYRKSKYADDPAYKSRILDSCARRTARKRNAPVYETVKLSVLYARDQGRCGLCLLPVTWKTASIDHIVPLSEQGEHSYRNTQLAHRRCNARKGNRRSVPSQLRLLP